MRKRFLHGGKIMPSFLMQLIVTAIIIFSSIGMPAIRRSANEARSRMKNVRRKPSDYGNITLDGIRVSERGKGVLNPSRMYSETNRETTP